MSDPKPLQERLLWQAEHIRAAQPRMAALLGEAAGTLNAHAKALRELHEYLYEHVPGLPMMKRARAALAKGEAPR